MYHLSMKKYGILLGTLLMSLSATAQEHEVGQKDKTFVQNDKKIEKLVIKVGDTVHFKNYDPWFHNIFSLSDIKTFDLGSYPQGQFKSVTFDTAGESEIECAIHPQMYMVVEVQE